VVLIGLSYGGQVAVDFALEHPDRVLALVTAGATVRGQPLETVGDRPAIYRALKERGAAEAVRLWLEDPAFVTARELPGVQDRMRRMLTDNVKGWGTPRPDLVRWPSRVPVDHLGEIAVPTLVLRGGQENPNIVAAADLLAARIPRATLQIISAAGHHLNMEAPEQFDAAVLAFLRAAGFDTETPRPGQDAC
jgi:pimeloyl-ACP methyl ester carboxylesterase